MVVEAVPNDAHQHVDHDGVAEVRKHLVRAAQGGVLVVAVEREHLQGFGNIERSNHTVDVVQPRLRTRSTRRRADATIQR